MEIELSNNSLTKKNTLNVLANMFSKILFPNLFIQNETKYTNIFNEIIKIMTKEYDYLFLRLLYYDFLYIYFFVSDPSFLK